MRIIGDIPPFREGGNPWRITMIALLLATLFFMLSFPLSRFLVSIGF